jgi:hypothetical protein
MRNLKFLAGVFLGGVLTAGGFLVAQGRHPNLDAAQQLIDQALVRLDGAQRANEFDMGGHAQNAKNLLMQAKGEIRAAAQAANH